MRHERASPQKAEIRWREGEAPLGHVRSAAVPDANLEAVKSDGVIVQDRARNQVGVAATGESFGDQVLEDSCQHGFIASSRNPQRLRARAVRTVQDLRIWASFKRFH